MKFKVEKMMCGGCTSNVQAKLQTLEGVENVTVDLESATAEVQGTVDPELVIETLNAINHPTSLIE